MKRKNICYGEGGGSGGSKTAIQFIVIPHIICLSEYPEKIGDDDGGNSGGNAGKV